MRTDLDLVRLNLIPGMTPRAVVVLLDRYGTAGAALRADPREITRLRDVGAKLAARIGDPPSREDALDEVRRAERCGIRILHLGGEGYPGILREIPDPPVALYVRGPPGGEEELAVAVVGARRASVYGRVQAERFGSELARVGLTVVSGLARGVDGAAHRGALDAGGRTVAVLGCGLDRVYPPEHRGLAAEIVAGGGQVLSEFPMRAPPLRHHFPIRNRVIAGLSTGVVVVEGRLRSGSLITARLANECGRTVYAVPGRVDSDLGHGPHSLIRDGAVLVTGPEDVLLDLGLVAPDAEAVPPPADPLQARVLEILDPSEPRGVDELLGAIPGDAPAVLAALTALELSGRVRSVAGRRYVRRPDVMPDQKARSTT